MKKVSKLKAVIAATVAVAAITSVTVFAASSSGTYNYSLAANVSSPAQTYTSAGNTMTLNTRPTAGAVTVKVEGLGIPGGETSESFPATVSRVDMKVTGIYKNLNYDVTVTAGTVACSGTLTVNTFNQ